MGKIAYNFSLCQHMKWQWPHPASLNDFRFLQEQLQGAERGVRCSMADIACLQIVI